MRESNKLYSIHFLRFIAAAAVVVHHVIARYQPKLIVGAAGVDIFFIISGLVIGLAMLSGEDPDVFSIRRLIRIYPIYWIATIVYVAFRMWAWAQLPSPIEALGSLVIFPVFGAAWHPIYWPAWTLEYEISFYALAAILIALARSKAAYFCILILVCVSLLRIHIPDSRPSEEFNFSRFQEFAAGIALAFAVKNRITVGKHIGAVLIAVAIALFYVNRELHFFIQVIGWGIPSVMATVGVMAFEDVPFFRSGIFKIGGDASYAIYLFHVTTIEFIAVIFFKAGFNPDTFGAGVAVAYSIFCIAAALAVGVLAHMWIERPVLAYLRGKYIRRFELLQQPG
ncbi:acyltransferase family protein [Paraburkholderia silvatlantica]|uniref:Exopolysaccharide production protein ExoZ n=1 Tax=Paraburkholderia silvatlantica TaxID=321895 RepID=A0ABR6FZY5_9BURK|nr:acyltransferase [Paraburkholderia silvatlantica]MBB2932963.1 exopolysaccharide production protein ExoZ [Paraburkholderia silvatlantica]PVY15338.1 peptidoglycan/LPS O-acetylase OafA/YrhL [Paraburkholderia silvatlantica]PXW23005.1 peptidoglycan/LPS O-acetylase OafA/YrhL [Paraburkholderia silvatlantica]